MVLRNTYRLTRRDLLVSIALVLGITVAGVALYSAGYNESFYSENEGVRGVFEGLTELGGQGLYVVVLALIYLSYDKRFGRRLCYLFFFVVYATDLLKEFFHDPRPPSNLARVEPYTSYGFPSGHTTTSISFYGYILMSHLGEARARMPLVLLCGFVIVVVPISRMVIGVHDLQDVVGGVVIGFSILVAYMVLQPRAAPVVKAWPMEKQVISGVNIAIVLWLAGGMVLALRHPGGLLVGLEETSMGAGLLLGCALAFPLEEAYVDYRPEKMGMKHRVIAAAVGLPLTIFVFVGMSSVSDHLLPAHVANVVTYSVLITVLTLFVPFILKRFMVTDGPSMDVIEE
jgi:membrane-associated phospholipid phosphatase